MRRFGRTDNNGPDGKYAWDGSILIIWCNGSNSLTDWRRNLQTGMIGHRGSRINREDYLGAMAVEHELRDEIAQATSVELYGVSRGWAIACWLSMRIPAHIPVQLNGWAGKRFGNTEAVLDVSERCVGEWSHIAYRGDIVPFLPLRYDSLRPSWLGRITWPWRAHMRAVRAAARHRHLLSRELR